MKVLLLNPHVTAEHELVKSLQSKGYAVLLPTTPDEAWQMLVLHGNSVDLAIVHREGAPAKDGEEGFKFIARFKADPAQADLPYVVTSHKWGDSEFARHQGTPHGANAYLKWPFKSAALLTLIDAVFNGSVAAVPEAERSQASVSLQMQTSTGMAPKREVSSPSIPTASGATGAHELVLEDASSLFANNKRPEKSDTSIKLEAPEFEQSKSSISVPTASEVSLAPPEEAPPVEAQPESSIALAAPEELPSAIELSAAPASSEGEGGSAAAALAAQLNGGDLQIATDEPAIEPLAMDPVPQDGPSLSEPPAAELPPADLPDEQAAEAMPYLYQSKARGMDPGAVFAQPLGDAVVPGGAAQSPDSETLKKYLLLREQDVAVLSTQLKATKDQVKSLEDSLREERARNAELTHLAEEQKRKLDEFEKEKQHALDSLQAEITELRFQLKARSDKARLMETQVREAADEMERLKDRVRSDIRKIRVREKELENRLEIMKKDSEALISARENKIIELKRKLDLLEFNMDLLQDQYAREKENAQKLRERLAKAAQVVRVAGGLLDSPGGAAQLAAALAEEGSGGDKDAA